MNKIIRMKNEFLIGVKNQGPAFVFFIACLFVFFCSIAAVLIN